MTSVHCRDMVPVPGSLEQLVEWRKRRLVNGKAAFTKEGGLVSVAYIRACNRTHAAAAGA